jgi:hypothetical protein
MALICRDRPDLNFAGTMFHELMHVDKDENDLPVCRPPEWEGFSAEVERFGIWRPSMQSIAKAFQDSLLPEEQNEASNRRAARGAGVRKSGNRARSANAAS